MPLAKLATLQVKASVQACFLCLFGLALAKPLTISLALKSPRMPLSAFCLRFVFGRATMLSSTAKVGTGTNASKATPETQETPQMMSLPQESTSSPLEETLTWPAPWQIALFEGVAHVHRTVRCASTEEALTLVAKVGALADVHQHHPCIVLCYRQVGFYLRTYDTDCLSEKDATLALAINEIIYNLLA
jgi:4a-hydroxytetrahydrobiopterin dehydratase